MRYVAILAGIGLILAVTGTAGATPQWYTISFTGADMFNYTTTVAPRADQEAPRRLRSYEGAPDYAMTQELRSDGDTYLNPGDGINDFAEWASGNYSAYGFSYFNLSGYTSPPGGWGQKYQAVPDQDNGLYGADSWRNQTVNGVPVTSGMGTANAWWDGGIVLANQWYNPDDYAFPVWRAPVGTQLTTANAASLTFSVDVLLETPDTAFESDGSLRVWFGGFNVPQEDEGPSQSVSGIVLSPIPEPVTMAGLVLGIGCLARYVRRRKV